MRWLTSSSGTIVMLTIFAIMLTKTARETGIVSSGFLWSMLICAVVATIALTVRYWRERNSGSNGSRRNNHQPSGLN